MVNSNSDYSVVSNSEAASIINRFTPEMIEDIINNAIANKFRNYTNQLVNIVAAIDQNNKVAMISLPDFANEIKQNGDELYLSIISKICSAHNLTFIGDTNSDLYSVAYTMYDFFISQFNLYMYNFFTTYINREKNALYENLELSNRKKETPQYSKKIYKNDSPKLAIIHANLEYVIDNIFSYDIDFNTFVDYACIPDRVKGNFLMSNLVDNGNFFKNFVVPYYQANYGLITSSIRFELQGLGTTDISDVI